MSVEFLNIVLKSTGSEQSLSVHFLVPSKSTGSEQSLSVHFLSAPKSTGGEQSLSVHFMNPAVYFSFKAFAFEMTKMKRPSAATEKDKHKKKKESEPAERTGEPTEDAGLKESPAPKDKPNNEATSAPPTPSDSGTLNSTRLKLHETTTTAIKGLKEGLLTEEEFWKQISKDNQGPLWKHFASHRKKDEEAAEAWRKLGGPGVVAKKRKLLLHFLRTGTVQGGSLKESQEASHQKTDNELFEWVPWVQLCKWYGETEAKDRVESGMVAVRKVGQKKRFFEFLLVKQTTSLSWEQKQRIAAEMKCALEGKELQACKKALKAPTTKQDWEDWWDNKKTSSAFQLADAFSSDSDLCEGSEDQESSNEHDNPAMSFLQGLQKSHVSKNSKEKAVDLAKKKKEEKQAQRDKAKREKEALKDAKKQKAEDTWNQKLEEATQVEENQGETKIRKMLGLITKMVTDFKKACKKANEPTHEAELNELQECRAQLEDLVLEDDLEQIRVALTRAASALKAAKKCIGA